MRLGSRTMVTVLASAAGVVGLAVMPAQAGDATWNLPAIDLSVSGQDAKDPQIAVSADAVRQTAVWYRFNGSNLIIQARTSTDGGTTWGATTDLSATGRNSSAPQIASSSDGSKLTAVWNFFNGSYGVAQARTSTDGGTTWGATTNLSGVGDDADGPQIVSSADGSKLTAVWFADNGSNFIAQARSSTDGGTTWGATTDLSTAGRDAENPQVAASSDGSKVTAVWFRSNGSNRIIQARTSTDSGATWGTTTDLSATGRTAWDPQIAASTDGSRLAAVWRRFDGSKYIVQSRSSTDGGTNWDDTTDLSATGQDADGQQIASSADGKRLTTVWWRSDGTKTIVQSRTSTDGGTNWDPVVDMSAAGENSAGPQIASSADGRLLTTIWYRFNGSNYIVQSRASTDGGMNWAAPIDLSAVGGSGYFPQVSTSTDGVRLAAVWQRSDANVIVQTLSGSILLPAFTSTPSSLDFGNRTIDTDDSRTVTITNTGDWPLTISAVALTGAHPGEFTVTSETCTSVPLAPQATCQVTIRFRPTSTGPKSASLTFTDDSPSGRNTVALSGAGTSTPAPTPTPKPTPDDKKTQKPADSKGKPPARVKKAGVTVITGANARTNAKQLIRTRVRCLRGSATAGERRNCTVIRGPRGKVSVRTYGQSNLRVIVVQRAPSTPEFKAYRKRTVYVSGVKQ